MVDAGGFWLGGGEGERVVLLEAGDYIKTLNELTKVKK